MNEIYMAFGEFNKKINNSTTSLPPNLASIRNNLSSNTPPPRRYAWAK